MNILILGKGYVGTVIYNQLKPTPHQLMFVSKADHAYDQQDVFERLVRENNIEVVVNASGYTGRPNVDACELNRDDTWYYNVVVPGMIGESCRLLNAHLIHVSSGCIYNGYDKEYTEIDPPDFGICCETSSWYSKTKHAGELALQGTGASVLRIRMPFCETTSERNILMKLLKYDNIINQTNSMTNIEDLAEFVEMFLENERTWGGIFNVVNPQPISTSVMIDALKQHDVCNSSWKYIELDELLEKHTTTCRSNCVLDSTKLEKLNLSLPDTHSSLNRCVKMIRDAIPSKYIQP